MEVYLISSPVIDDNELDRFLVDIGVPGWKSTADNDPQRLIEIAGRLCYNSFLPGLNRNVNRVREDSDEYIKNLIKQQHGSVFEHAQFSFIFRDVSVICLAELCRHRVGIAISQQSGRYVVPVPEMFPNPGFPDEFWNEYIRMTFKLYYDILYSDGGDYDKLPFSRKKELTSIARGIMPQRMYSRIQWSANVRSLRHIIELRTSPHAEAEIQELFKKVSEIMSGKYPTLFGDI